MEIQSPFLIEAEVAALLRLRPHTLSNWRSRGFGPPFSRLGGSIRYPREGLVAWIAACQRTSTTDAQSSVLARG